MKKRYKFLIVFVLVIGIVSYIVLIHVLPFAIIKPPRTTSLNYLNENHVNYEEVQVISFDSLLLSGYYVKSALKKTKTSIILVHGVGGCKEHFTELASNLSKMGYDCWVFDNRAHGKSGGLYNTYGFFEKKDISAITNKIKEVTPNTKVAIWGNSLGGAIAIQAMAYDKRIDFGIIESTFTNLRQIVQDYQKQMSYGIGVKFAANIALNEAGVIGRFNPDEVSPLQSAKQLHQPILICHGDSDKNINVKYGKALYNHLASKEKDLIIVKGGEHFGLFSTGGNDYKNKLYSFLHKQSNRK